jgi:DNA-binding HxlR family transcriptional regulator
LTKDTWNGRQNYKEHLTIVKQVIKRRRKGTQRDILEQLRELPQGNSDLYFAFPEIAPSTIRGRLSDLKRMGRIKKEDGKWWVL